MDITVAIPIFNQLNDCKGILALLRENTSDDVEWLIIDNGSTDPVEEFITRKIKPKRLNYIRNKQNIGVVPTMQQIYKNTETDLLAVFHNDVFIYEKEWDVRVRKIFEENPNIGLMGLFGCAGVGPNGDRLQDVEDPKIYPGMSNMIEAEAHGMRIGKEIEPVSIVDGMGIIFRKEMLDKVGGFDQRYSYHHYYDRDASLESLKAGYDNVVINISCHHLNGLTANRGEYQEWINEKTKGVKRTTSGDKWTHDHNMELFQEKWGDVLPLYVEPDFSFREKGVDSFYCGVYKGDDIRTKK